MTATAAINKYSEKNESNIYYKWMKVQISFMLFLYYIILSIQNWYLRLLQ